MAVLSIVHVSLPTDSVCLQEEKFREVSEALRLAQIQWTKRGPPNKRWVMFGGSFDLVFFILTWILYSRSLIILVLSGAVKWLLRTPYLSV